MDLPALEFATANRVIFGAGRSESLPELIVALGQRVLVVTGGHSGRFAALVGRIRAGSKASEIFAVAGEPTVELVQTGTRQARAMQCDVVAALGGGSVIDAGKAIAALANNPGDPIDYLEVVGRGYPLKQPSLPLVAAPTTAGTGAEVTRNAVLAVPEARVKVSLRSPHLLPAVAVVDPVLTQELPPALTASTGIDALTQLIEPYLSSRSNPLTDALCRDGIPRAARALPIAFRDRTNLEARTDMSLASLFGGLALANAGLGGVHGFAGPIGGMFPAPHGSVCAALLPHVLQANLDSMRRRAPAHPALDRMNMVGQWLTGRPDATAEDAITWCAELVTAFSLPRLQSWGVASHDIAEIVRRAANASSMKANPLPLTVDEMSAILHAALAA